MTVSRPLQGWRKLARSAWSNPSDPQFYGDLEIDAANLQSYLSELRRDSGVHVTVTHAVVKAIAHGFTVVPSLNIRIAHGKEYPRPTISVLVIVAAGDELTGVKINDVDTKSLVDIAREIDARVAAIRAGDDVQFGRTKAMLQVLPGPLLRLGIRLSAWLTSDLDIDLPQYGLPRQAFGSAMVSSIGMTGITHGYSPLASYYRVPLLFLVGAVQEKPVVVDGRILARPILTLTATVDHRYTDGLQAARFGSAARDYLANPRAYESRVTEAPPVMEPNSSAPSGQWPEHGPSRLAPESQR